MLYLLDYNQDITITWLCVLQTLAQVSPQAKLLAVGTSMSSTAELSSGLPLAFFHLAWGNLSQPLYHKQTSKQKQFSLTL